MNSLRKRYGPANHRTSLFRLAQRLLQSLRVRGDRVRFLLQFRHAPLLLALTFVSAFASSANAIVFGTPSPLGANVLRVIGASGAQCSGAVIDRHHVVTAGHCGGAAIILDGKYISAINRAQTAKLSDGRTITVHGDAAILIFRQALPASAIPIEIGVHGTDGDFTIAGYGTTSEQRWNLGKLHEANVVVHVPFKLVAPDRMSNLTASACFGDSGGAVLRNGKLVGVITRASHPHPAIACGHLTHYAPIIATPAVEYHPHDGFEVSAAPRNPQRRLMYQRAVTPR